MDVQTRTLLTLIALTFVLCLFIVTCIVIALNAHKQQARLHAQQEHQDSYMQEHLRLALVQQEVELRILHLLAHLRHLRQVMGCSEEGRWYLSDCLLPLEERRLALEHCTHLLYHMALDRRVTLHEVSNLESAIEHLWNRYDREK